MLRTETNLAQLAAKTRKRQNAKVFKLLEKKVSQEQVNLNPMHRFSTVNLALNCRLVQREAQIRVCIW